MLTARLTGSVSALRETTQPITAADMGATFLVTFNRAAACCEVGPKSAAAKRVGGCLQGGDKGLNGRGVGGDVARQGRGLRRL